MATWEISVGRAENEPPPIEVVRYEAVVALSLERSSLNFNREMPRDVAINAILSPPQWTLRPWSAPPPNRSDPGISDHELERWAVQKFKALFDFAAALPDGTADELETHLVARFPLIGAARDDSAAEISRYKRISVHSEILQNGDAQWGFDLPEAGELPPGIPGLHVPEPGSSLDTSNEHQPTALDVFVQNIVRIDLERRLENQYGL